MYLNRENLIFVQACLWNVGRRDQFIKFHVAGGLDTFRRPQLEHVQRTVAQLMGCQPEYVIVAGIEPSNSIVVTLMVLEAYIELLPCADKYELGLLKASVDSLNRNRDPWSHWRSVDSNPKQGRKLSRITLRMRRVEGRRTASVYQSEWSLIRVSHT